MGMPASTVLVTGADRGLDWSLAVEPVSRSAAVHAGARDADQTASGHGSADGRETVAGLGGGGVMAEAAVLICDAQELMRAGLRTVVDGQVDLTVVGEAGDGERAVAQALTLRPDLVLMEAWLPRLDGISATAQLRAALPDTRVLVLTACDRDEYAYAALRAGASGFLVKDTPAAEMLVAVRGVLRGDTMVAPSVTRRLIERYVTGAAAPVSDARLDVLTDREREVLGLVGRGLNNAEIAGKLFLGETTVKTHVARILAKLHIRDRIQAVVVAHESGLVRPGG